MVTQVVHIPTLNLLSDFFQITYLHDVSEEAMKHSQLKVAGPIKPTTTRDMKVLCGSAEVDLVLIASNHAFHAHHAVTGLQAGKYVFIEKPIALTLKDVDVIIQADRASGGGKTFVGYMRRYAAAFEDAVKEVASIGQVRYARVRDIIGPNSVFISQSGTYPRTFNDYHKGDSDELSAKTQSDIYQAIHSELRVTPTKDAHMMWEMLSILGSHDLSTMREILGMPTGVVGFSPCSTTGSPFWR